MIYGIINQHNGFINVASDPDHGTAFRIYLPLVDAEGHECLGPIVQPLKGGNETILLVEDDDAVRMMLKDVLESYGYTVIAAEDGEEALTRFHAHRDSIGLLLSDIMLPKKSGTETYNEIRKIRPDIHVIFTSGYSVAATRELLEEKLICMAKPVSPRELLIKMREVLDR